MSSVGFEPANPIVKLPQTYALDRTATGIRSRRNIDIYYISAPAKKLFFKSFLFLAIDADAP
jgi:hypothetical protein